MNPATATRAEIRNYVHIRQEQRIAIGKSGGSIRHAELDQQDELEDLVKDLEHDQRERFLRIYTEEAIASIDSSPSDSDKALKAVKRANKQDSKAAGVMIFLILIAVLIVVLSK